MNVTSAALCLVESADALCDDVAFRLASVLVDDALSDPLSDVEHPAIPTTAAIPAHAASMRVRRIVLLDIMVSVSCCDVLNSAPVQAGPEVVVSAANHVQTQVISDRPRRRTA